MIVIVAMKTKFKELLKGIFLTSVASLVSSNEANAISYDLSKMSNDNNIEQKKKSDLSQKYILKSDKGLLHKFPYHVPNADHDKC